MKNICEECKWNAGFGECDQDFKKKTKKKGSCEHFKFPDYP